MNHLQRLRHRYAKYEIDCPNGQKLDESAETGTSNILAALREEFTDKEESRVGGPSALIGFAHLAAADSTDENPAP